MVTTYLIGEIITIGALAVALSLDGFSIGIGMGMYRIRVRRIAIIGGVIGLFHMVMPLIGMVIGQALSTKFGNAATIAGGILLLFVGVDMIRSSFKEQRVPSLLSPYGFGLLLFGLMVSLDSLSAGLTLGIFGARMIVTVLLFGIASMVLTWAGLLVGQRVQGWFGTYSEAIGGCILFAFGLKLLFMSFFNPT